MKKTWLIIILSGIFFQLQGQQQIDIYHHVPFIPQPTNVSCWSTSMAMILWWRDNENAQMSQTDALTPAQVAGRTSYWQQYFVDGLDGFDTNPLDTFGFITVPPSSFSIATLADFLRHSPVWVAYDGCSNPLNACNHAVVLIGMRGDGTPEGTSVILHDPDDGSGTYPNLGVRDNEMAYEAFIQRLNSRALRLLSDFPNENRTLHFLAYLR